MNLYKAKNGFSVRKSGDEMVLVPPVEYAVADDALIKLNDASLLLWKALANELNIMQLTKVLTDRFSAYAYEVIDEVDDFLQKLIACSAVEIREVDLKEVDLSNIVYLAG